MIFGITTFTLIHVVLSLVGIFAGLVVAGGLVAGKRLDGWTGVFLLTTVATSVTGFGFPFVAFLPSHAVGIVSLGVLADQGVRPAGKTPTRACPRAVLCARGLPP